MLTGRVRERESKGDSETMCVLDIICPVNPLCVVVLTLLAVVVVLWVY